MSLASPVPIILFRTRVPFQLKMIPRGLIFVILKASLHKIFHIQNGQENWTQAASIFDFFFEMLAPLSPDSNGPASYLVQDTSALPTEDDAKRVNDGHRNAEKAHSGI